MFLTQLGWYKSHTRSPQKNEITIVSSEFIRDLATPKTTRFLVVRLNAASSWLI